MFGEETFRELIKRLPPGSWDEFVSYLKIPPADRPENSLYDKIAHSLLFDKKTNKYYTETEWARMAADALSSVVPKKRTSTRTAEVVFNEKEVEPIEVKRNKAEVPKTAEVVFNEKEVEPIVVPEKAKGQKAVLAAQIGIPAPYDIELRFSKNLSDKEISEIVNGGEKVISDHIKNGTIVGAVKVVPFDREVREVREMELDEVARILGGFPRGGVLGKLPVKKIRKLE